jgi:hypothetical protein
MRLPVPAYFAVTYFKYLAIVESFANGMFSRFAVIAEET